MAIDHSSLQAPIAKQATLDSTADDVAVVTVPPNATSVMVVADGGSAIKVVYGGTAPADSSAIGADYVLVASGASVTLPLESTGSPGQQMAPVPALALASATSSATCALVYGA